MVYAVMGAMAFTNTSRRNNAHTWLVTRLAPEGMWGSPTVVDADMLNHAPAPAVICEVRFVDQAARDAFFTDALAQLSGANGPIVGSWIAKHVCYHDEPVPLSCIESERHEF